MQATGIGKAPSLQQLLTAPITRTFPRFLWTRQNIRVRNSVRLSCQLFDRLQGATVPMKLPVQVYVVVQPADWEVADYLCSLAPQQQLIVTNSNSSVPKILGAPDAGWEEVRAAALPTAAAGPGSKPLGPFPAYVSRSKAGKLDLVNIQHDGKLYSYRCVSGSPGAHDVVLFEQVCVCVLMLVHDAEVVGGFREGISWLLACDLLMCLHSLQGCAIALLPCCCCRLKHTWCSQTVF